MSRVLIVDDHEENRTLLDTLLRSCGYTVMRANNGAEALQAARSESPELVISDIFMPVMDGFALCREWNRDERLRQIPFVFYTATYTDPGDEELGLSLGAVRFLVKGMEPEAFVAIVRQVIQEHETGRLIAPRQPVNEETVYYRLYNEALVRKLEQKVLALETAKRTLERDITDRKRAEEKLGESEALFRSVFEQHAAVKLIIDPDTGSIVDANEAAERFYGWSRDRLKHMQIQDINTRSPEEVKAKMEQARAHERIHFEFRHRRADGSIRDVEVFSSRITAGGKELLHSIVHDVSDRKRVEREKAELEAQLRQQQKLEAIGTLASGVAHEINNPITGIMNYAQLIADAAPGSKAGEYAGEIVRETERVATIVRNLLQFARQEKPSHSRARVADILERTLSLLRAVLRRDQITLEVDVPEDLPSLKCRSQQIQQVLMNLLTNARDALNERYPGYHPDKTIRVTVRPFEQDGRRWLRVTVADQGNGIPGDIRERIFDPFFTTKPRDQGTGLGLSISHGIVKDHQGALHFETEPGVGTQFHLDLPADNGWAVEGK